MGFNLCFQGFDQELASLPGDYAPPRGRLLLAYVDGQPAGCVGLHQFEPGVCEMKRLYLRSAFRGSGLGRRLAEQIIAAARELGYQAMRLDTIERLMPAAVALYRDLGFHEIPSYRFSPVEGTLCMELDLTTPQR